MTEEPTQGDRAICKMCNNGIVYVGPYWNHLGELQPRHPAIPIGQALKTIEYYERETGGLIFQELMTFSRLWKIGDDVVHNYTTYIVLSVILRNGVQIVVLDKIDDR